MTKNQQPQRVNATSDTNLTNNGFNKSLLSLLKSYFPQLILLLIFSLPSQAESLFAHFKLPPLHRAPAEDAASKYLQNAMVLKRLESIPVKFTDIDGPEQYTETLRKTITEKIPTWPTVYNKLEFKGTKFSQLNNLIQKQSGKPIEIEINSPQLNADETLIFSSNIFIDGNDSLILPNKLKPAILFTNGIRNSGIKNLYFKQPNHAIHLQNVEQIQISRLNLKQSNLGITVSGPAKYLSINYLNITDTRNSGVVIQGDSHHISIKHTRFTSGLSAKNEAAALFLTDAVITTSLFTQLTEHQAIAAQPIFPASPSPHHILIEHNIFKNNRAQGVYLDGANGVVLRSNEISNNDKEGLCLDFGAANNIIAENIINANGNRAFQSDDDLKHDLVFGFGRMPDGSAISKLPGISLDNAAQNIAIKNSITNNAGDGIKIVRSGFRNLIMFNSIVDNNKGHNSRFHFFGILLGSAGAEPEVISAPDKPLDFMPSIENIIAGNIIYGAHHSAILLDKDAAFNDVYDNIARQYVHMPIESASQSFNSAVGNSWNNIENTTSINAWLKNLLKK